MPRRDAGNSTRTRRPGPGRVALWTPVVLVVLLFAAAVVVDVYDVGPRHLGWKGADPRTDPAAVVAPPVLDLPELVTPEPVADGAPGAELDAELVAAAVRGTLPRGDVGPRAAVLVAGLSGDPVVSRGPARFVPASTTKLLTAVAALEVLGPDTTFETRVVEGAQGRGPREVVLVGGGDPLLASEPAEVDAWPPRADVRTLAAQAAEALVAGGTKRVRLRYDTSLFSGPADSPAWEPSYVPDGVVSPIVSLWVDRGVPASGWGRVADPARVAAETFAEALRAEGVRVAAVRPGRAAGDAAELAAVSSPTVAQIVERVVDVSDNELAEVLTRHIGLAVSGEGSFEVGTAATLDTLVGLGVDTTGAVVNDGSGLSRDNRLSARTLLDVVRVAASAEHPHLRAAVVGLPVAGFSGSLTSRFAGERANEGLGVVRAKTGTLTGVHALAGLVTGADGVPMVFVAAVDRVPAEKSLDARAALDRLAAGLAGCACSVDENVGGVG